MLDKIKDLRLKAIKEKNQVARYAYESVITECQTTQGRGIELTEQKIVKIIKGEISKYQEMFGDKSQEIKLLSVLLPEEKPVLSEQELETIFTGQDLRNPKLAMEYLDNNGYSGRYDKGLVAKLALRKK